MSNPNDLSNKIPGVPDDVPTVLRWGLYVFREVGMTGALIAVIVYLLVVQMPEMRNDFRTQTDKLVDAVGNNNKVMSELSGEIKQLRQDRWEEWWREWMPESGGKKGK